MSQALGDGQQARVSTTIPTLSVTSGKDCVIEGLVNNVPVSILGLLHQSIVGPG